MRESGNSYPLPLQWFVEKLVENEDKIQWLTM
nr:MAG TPA: hypothetical protein [Caudoviricetes sp.]